MILVLNAGSSSLKVALFDGALSPLLDGQITEIGGTGTFQVGSAKRAITTADHAAALSALLAEIEAAGYHLADLDAAAHRVVHGGTTLTAPARLTADVIAAITDNVTLAPLHNPASLSVIHAMRARLPNLLQCASFDTAFHATNPDVASRYAIPQVHHDAGIRRYGFHGLSYASMVTEFGAAIPARLLALHLGNGASLCAIKNGQSVATSMGYSPMSGLTMGTRSGDIDGAAVLRVSAAIGEAATDHMLNKNSGLKALAGDSNMKTLLDRKDADAAFAVDHFCYWAARQAGSAIVAMGGLDAIAFTGGIGENASAVRVKITEHLACFGNVPVHVVPAQEEKQIARDARTVMGAA